MRTPFYFKTHNASSRHASSCRPLVSIYRDSRWTAHGMCLPTTLTFAGCVLSIAHISVHYSGNSRVFGFVFRPEDGTRTR